MGIALDLEVFYLDFSPNLCALRRLLEFVWKKSIDFTRVSESEKKHPTPAPIFQNFPTSIFPIFPTPTHSRNVNEVWLSTICSKKQSMEIVVRS